VKGGKMGDIAGVNSDLAMLTYRLTWLAEKSSGTTSSGTILGAAWLVHGI
jgi:hypothetical protein